MSKIVNHPHWNEDLWDNPAESAAIPPSDVNRRDIVITQPGGLRQDDRTDAEKLAETGLLKVNAVAGEGVVGKMLQQLDQHDKRISSNAGGVATAKGEITSTKEEVQRIKTDIIPATEAKIAEAKQALDREISQRLDLIPEGYISAYCDTTVNAGGSLLQALKNIGWNDPRQNERLIPFNHTFGASQGAHLDVANRRVVFDKPGTWIVFTRATAGLVPTGGHQGNYHTWNELKTYTETDQLRETRITTTRADLEATLHFSEAIVVPRAGYSVRLWVRSNNWRNWYGGFEWNNITCLLMSNNAGRIPVGGSKEEAGGTMEDNLRYERRIRR